VCPVGGVMRAGRGTSGRPRRRGGTPRSCGTTPAPGAAAPRARQTRTPPRSGGARRGARGEGGRGGGEERREGRSAAGPERYHGRIVTLAPGAAARGSPGPGSPRQSDGELEP